MRVAYRHQARHEDRLVAGESYGIPVSHGFGWEIVQLPEAGGKQCKCMISLAIVHCLGWKCNDPFEHEQTKPPENGCLEGEISFWGLAYFQPWRTIGFRECGWEGVSAASFRDGIVIDLTKTGWNIQRDKDRRKHEVTE